MDVSDNIVTAGELGSFNKAAENSVDKVSTTLVAKKAG